MLTLSWTTSVDTSMVKHCSNIEYGNERLPGGKGGLQFVLVGLVLLLACLLVLVYVHLTAAIADLSRRLESVEGRLDLHRSPADVDHVKVSNPEVKTIKGKGKEYMSGTVMNESLADITGRSSRSGLRRRRDGHAGSRTREYTNLGCWRDTRNHAIPTLEGTDPRLDGVYWARGKATEKCYQVALSRGFPVFAVQAGGYCSGSADAHNTYKKYGPSTACASDGEGGPRANEVYWITGLDQCEAHLCQNNATCRTRRDGYTCTCTKGWYGKYCQHSEYMLSYDPPLRFVL
ncbi:Hypp8651 [Branchiostoma lanceolatum]|uniref:Hypp8651 protein n=1 Tax=Branchiostoma lanceolatum TaxID=7740 RepID=A0A8K0EE58_BRALA|nr:Hypp8651 [Branchiostoma lanceolatum]